MKSKVDWQYCQQHSDQVLAEGLEVLRSKELLEHKGITCNDSGNYVILLDGTPFYIGEAGALCARIRQQFSPQRSTFFKTYLSNLSTPHTINDFRVQFNAVHIGRKELEEFGIVNLETSLNKFQLEKRNRVSSLIGTRLWEHIQNDRDRLLNQGEETLFSLNSIPWLTATVPASSGLYKVNMADSDEILYIGESSNIAERYKTHSKLTYFSALRRHIGTEVLGFSLAVRNGKKRYFAESEDSAINAYLKRCRLSFLSVSFGRLELESLLIRKHKPLLNRKDKSR